MGYEEFSTAMTNRSLRTIKTELEFLADSSVITQQQLSTILNQLPDENGVARRANQTPSAALSRLSLNNTNGSYNEKQNGNDYDQQQPPPSYSAPSPPPRSVALTNAVALYAYNGTDEGDLSLQPNDRIAVTEYTNAEWWKGRNERTGEEGIFPRSYVKVEEKAMPRQPPPSNYGNMPMDVAQGGSSGSAGGGSSKLQDGGKKFGKKLGNAAIFGAGATIGSSIVGAIL